MGVYTKSIEAIYQEDRSAANEYRAEYLRGMEKLLEVRKQEARAQREEYGGWILENREAARNELKRVLGWPLTETGAPVGEVKEKILRENDRTIVSRVQMETLRGLKFYGILMRHKSPDRLPLIISQHGGAGTPEVCSSFFDSTNYNDMSMRIFHQGVNVFAPQLLLWKEGSFGGNAYAARLEIDNDLRRVGGSVAAIEIYCIQQAMDVFEQAAWFDGRFGMIGLSYGGFYTLYTAACDTRISAALDCGFFCDRDTCYGTDFSWKDSLHRFSDAEVGALVFPRGLRIEYGDEDVGKHVVGVREECKRLERYYEAAQDAFSFRCFEGTHEFCPEDDGIKWVLERLGRT